ncbi:unnamed protein product [Toxocara canis]|uniref:GTD-binding domain-containing protein n=1 Tax=Toxocara canis TaxID=6265 RepID=A0A183UT63_TOXCA|nr:unnamed protein product [Toxocara canis]
MPTAVAAISRLIEEAKMRVLEADAEIKLAMSTRAEMQQLHLKLAAAEREFIDKYTDLGKKHLSSQLILITITEQFRCHQRCCIFRSCFGFYLIGEQLLLIRWRGIRNLLVKSDVVSLTLSMSN